MDDIKTKQPLSGSFKSLKPNQFTDKKIKQNDQITDKHKKFVYKGSTLNGLMHGPGSQLMEGGIVQYECNFIQDKQVGKGFCIMRDPFGQILQVTTTLDGHPLMVI